MRRRAFAIVLVAAVVLAVPTAAGAHVIPSPSGVPLGSTDQELTFRVPNEMAGASTVSVDMQMPTDHPLIGVLALHKPGWTVTVKTAKLPKPVVTDDGTITEAVSEVTWTGGSIPPGQYEDFSLAVGQVPKVGSTLTFKTIQTYSNGQQVAWIDAAPAGGPAPDHPAPVLALTAPTSGGSAGAATPGTATTTPVAPATKAKKGGPSRLAIGAGALSVVAVLLSGAALATARRRPTA